MSKLTLEIPDTLQMSSNEAQRFLAEKLYECGKLSLGQAAELANLSKAEFSDVLSDYDVSFINYSLEDVLNDARRI